MKRLLTLILVAQLCFVDIGIAGDPQVSSCKHNQVELATAGNREYCDAIQSNDGKQEGTLRSNDENCFRVAVVEYSRVDGDDCKVFSEKNLDIFEKIIRLAKDNGAQMIVLPEDGILCSTARKIIDCVEEIPDPLKLADDYNPCLQPNRFNPFPILTRLSCLAKQNQIYLIANYGTKERDATKCDTTQHDCDKEAADSSNSNSDDLLLLNTNVVFEPTGRYIRRYRKWNPFKTEDFVKPPKLEHVYFDTEFGRFGVFTCFDMIFREPAIELVERYGIDTALFPTWWYDELPLLSAVQYQDAWSESNHVNMLSSNILKPGLGSLGSSIFSLNSSVYVAPEDEHKTGRPLERKTKILLATIATRPRQTGRVCKKGFESKIIEIDENATKDTYTFKNFKLSTHDALKRFHKPAGTIHACSGTICCKIEYKLKPSGIEMDQERLLVIVRDGPRLGYYPWYEQICAVVTLKEPYKPRKFVSDLSRMEEIVLVYDSEASVSFEKVSIEATFNTRHVYPTTGHSVSRLLDRSRRRLTCHAKAEVDKYQCKLEFVPDVESSENNKLYTFALYGRVYNRDP